MNLFGLQSLVAVDPLTQQWSWVGSNQVCYSRLAVTVMRSIAKWSGISKQDFQFYLLLAYRYSLQTLPYYNLVTPYK